jgi:hypothetical protein
MADDDAPGTLTVPDITIVGQPESQDRVKFLNYLAWNPAEALRNWGRLSQDDQAYVEAMMQLHYGADFVQMFDAKASTNPRPDASIVITNDPSITPQSLQSAGYSHQRDVGGTSVWVHPSGQEVWLLPPPNAAPAPSVPPPEQIPLPCVPTHPDVEDAQNDASNFQSRFDALQQQFIQMQQYRSANNIWPPQVNDYANALNDLGTDIDSVLKYEAPQWEQDEAVMTDCESAALDAAIQQIRAIQGQLDSIDTTY